MKLLRLSLRHFKGIKNFTLDTQGGNVDLFGDNATGKTTLFDAFTWLLSDKDSQNKKDFEIKTLDENNEPLHGLDHEVEAVLDIDGKVVNIRKVYMEKWTKKRGTATAEFTGHTTEYFLDGVPAKKSMYEERIAKIASEDIFKLLTSPTFFNEQLHWQDRRKTLLEICGDLTDEEVIASDKALSKLPDILNGRSLEDHRKVIAARRTKINDELKKIPVRIDEVTQGLPDLSSVKGNDLHADIESLHSQIREKEQELSRIEGGGEIAEKRVQLKESESDLISLKNQLQGKISEQIDAKRREHQQIKSKIYDCQSEVRNKRDSLKYHQQQIEKLEAQREELRDKWYQINDQQFSFQQSDTCPTCGQALPQEQLESARKKALAAFNRDKADRLETITAKGKECKEQVESFQAELQSLNDVIKNKLEVKVEEYTNKAAEIEILIENMMKDANAYQEDPAYIAKLAEKEEVEAQIRQLQQDNTEAVGTVKAEIEQLGGTLLTLQTSLARVDQCKKGQNRIEELKQQERDLAAEFEKLEGELYLTEQFVKTKVNLLEEKINSKFKLARFKLFNVLVNGGVEECCETLYQGVPYSSGLNTGHRIMVGLDIINTLSEYYDFYPPIFIDNKETVTQLPQMKAQIISLIKPPALDDLDEEVREDLISKHGGYEEAMAYWKSRNSKLRVETEGAQNVLFKEVV